jgi:RNA polymerase sigma-70 factor (ECF subfamily)
MIYTDSDILSKLKSGNESGLEVLFDRYYKPLVVFSIKFVDSLDAAEDIVQDFFIRFWEDKKFLQVNESLKSYLFTSIRNSSLNYLKKNDKFIKLPEEIFNDELFFTTDDLDELEEKRKMLYIEINKLSPQSKKIFEAIILGNEKYKDVAKNLGISVNTVKTLLSRSLKKLRNSLDIIILILIV